MNKEYKFRGHKIELVNNRWFFSGSGKLVEDVWKKIPCGICGKKSTAEGHDECLGLLPGVINACCGHGQADEAYVMFSNEFILRGDDALNAISELARKPIVTHLRPKSASSALSIKTAWLWSCRLSHRIHLKGSLTVSGHFFLPPGRPGPRFS